MVITVAISVFSFLVGDIMYIDFCRTLYFRFRLDGCGSQLKGYDVILTKYKSPVLGGS